jgi:hypothetical protein
VTYGSLRLILKKLAPSIDQEIIDGWIQDRYTEILDRLPWKRLEAESTIAAPDSYSIGTLTATQGSNAITGAGTTWTAAMTGLMIRIANGQEYYQFTYVSATTGTLDRAFENVAGAGLTYRIDQNIFLLPSDARILRAVRPLHGGRPLEMITPAELDRRAPNRGSFGGTYGEPTMAAATWDNFSDPPNLQVELYPVPSSPDSSGIRRSWVLDYIFDPANPSSTSGSLLPWVRPAALEAGVEGDIKRHMDQLSSAEAFDKRFEQLVLVMAQVNALQRGPQTIRLAPELRRNRPTRWRRGPIHEGGNG